MVEIIATEEIRHLTLSPDANFSAYNGLDVLNTLDLYNELKTLREPVVDKTYAFSKALQGPVIDMMLTGVKIDLARRNEALHYLRLTQFRYQEIINAFSDAVCGQPLNVESPQQMKDFFYKTMGIPEVKTRKGREFKVSADKEALEKIAQYFYARPIVTMILALREINGEIEVLERKVSSDGRMRCSFNIAGTITGRFSSSKDISGEGANLQNIKGPLRDVFIADEGQKLGYIDLEQAESRLVGLMAKSICNDSTYLDSCLAGDLHTTVCKMVWPELPWTGDASSDKKVAETPYFGHYSFRDMSKRGGHLSNYNGSPGVMAIALKIPQHVAEEFQTKYFSQFPGIKEWHRWVATQLRTNGFLLTPFGRKRCFFARTEENKTLSEAISYAPQSCIADMLNDGMLRFWRKLRNGLPGQLLIQVHDAVVIQAPEESFDETVAECISCLEAPLEGADGFFIPSDAQSGWNWGKATSPYVPGKAYKKGEKFHFENHSKLFKTLCTVESGTILDAKSPAVAATLLWKNPGGMQAWKPNDKSRSRPPQTQFTAPTLSELLSP